MKISDLIKSLSLFLVFCVVSVRIAVAVPVYPGPIVVKQPDGTTLTIKLHGDEQFSYATTMDGYHIIADKGAYCYAAIRNGSFVSTGVPAKEPSKRGAEDRQALRNVGIGTPHSVAATAMMRTANAGIAYGATVNDMSPRAASGGNNAVNSGETFRSIVLLVEFPDMKFSVNDPVQAFHDLLNKDGYVENDATGSARDYYVQNSMGQFNPQFDVFGTFQMSGSAYSYYENLDGFVSEACRIAERNGVDFSPYVDDGILRDVFIFYAGYNNAESGGMNLIHPARVFYANSIDFGSYGGGRLKAAAFTSELRGHMYSGEKNMAGIGTFCHEFGHIMGWPDFYDTDYAENGTGFNLDVFSLMSSGSYINEGRTPPALNAYERHMVGWIELEEIDKEGIYTLEPLYDNKAYIINTFNDGEFFIMEYRNGDNFVWDTFLSKGNPGPKPTTGRGSGMIVYHVDRSDNTVPGGRKAKDLWGLTSNRVNAYGSHECMRILMANQISRPTVGNTPLSGIGKIFYPGTSNVTSLTSSEAPYFVGWNGFSTGWDLFDIKENGNDNVTFEVKRVKGGEVKNLEVTPHQFDITVSFVSPFKEIFRFQCEDVSGGSPTLQIDTNTGVAHFTGLKPGTKYKIRIFTTSGVPEEIETIEVSTTVADPAKTPTMNVKGSYEESDYIVLSVKDILGELHSVKWYVDDEEVKDTVIQLSGTKDYKIMAELKTSNGMEYIVKYITVVKK